MQEGLAIVAAIATFHVVSFLIIWIADGLDPLELGSDARR